MCRMRRVKAVVDSAGDLPSWATQWICSSPEASLTNAIFFPSGDHTASRSCAPGVAVRLRVIPFSIGAVKTSPRATMTARSALGESE